MLALKSYGWKKTLLGCEPNKQDVFCDNGFLKLGKFNLRNYVHLNGTQRDR